MAFDLMSVNLADLPLMPSLLPALRLLFEKEGNEADEQPAAAARLDPHAGINTTPQTA